MSVKQRRRTRRVKAGLAGVCARWPGPMVYQGLGDRGPWMSVTSNPGWAWVVDGGSRDWSDEFRSLLKAGT